ncbi:MAG: hypothetical protein LWW90_07400 [Candidatus Desulfofervidus auxilii]|nr:hypothetical protein [Candidatus Desulfofervidus auxilii]
MDNLRDTVKLYLETLVTHNEPIPEGEITIKPLNTYVSKKLSYGCLILGEISYLALDKKSSQLAISTYQ